MRTATAAALLAAGLLLAGCGGSDQTPDPPTTPAATPTATPPTLSKAQVTEQCIDAVADVISQRPADFDPETDDDPKPPVCEPLSESEYLDAYMDGLSQSNQEGIDELQRQIDEAAESDAP